MKSIKFGNRQIGDGHAVFIIAEIGINHNGDLETAKKLIDVAVEAGCDAVKFQKRAPEHCVPSHQQKVIRKTPWGTMTYLEYRKWVEFGGKEYAEIDSYCKERGIGWFASCWDLPSVDFMEQFNPSFYKIASACLTDDDLLQYINGLDRLMILSRYRERTCSVDRCRFTGGRFRIAPNTAPITRWLTRSSRSNSRF